MELPFDDYTVTTPKTFEEAVAAVRARAAANGFTVLAVHDLRALFGAKGFQHDPAVIVEMCSEPFGSQMLAAEPQMTLMMPCKICLYLKDGQVWISALRPRALGDWMPEFAPMAEHGDAVICRIVDEAK